MSSASKKLRACLMCSFVATAQEFKREGCPNCEQYLEVKKKKRVFNSISFRMG